MPQHSDVGQLSHHLKSTTPQTSSCNRYPMQLFFVVLQMSTSRTQGLRPQGLRDLRAQGFWDGNPAVRCSVLWVCRELRATRFVKAVEALEPQIRFCRGSGGSGFKHSNPWPLAALALAHCEELIHYSLLVHFGSMFLYVCSIGQCFCLQYSNS